MGLPFLIDNIPKGSVYCGRGGFLEPFKTGGEFDMPRLVNGIQVVDTRLAASTLQALNEKEFPDHLRHLFEIKDFLTVPVRGETLCSLSIFKMWGEQSSTGKPFDVYLNGVKDKIDYFRKRFPDQTLRVYAGDSTWDDLHRIGVLKERNTEFVRMASSSQMSELGTLWRFLAFDDYDYEYVYINETDGKGDFIDGEWVLDEYSDGSNGYHGTTTDRLKRDMIVEGSAVHFNCAILPVPSDEPRTASFPVEFPLLFYVDDLRLSDPLFIHRISEYVQTSTPSLARGNLRLPFDMTNVLLSVLTLGTERHIYHPETNLWTNVRERHNNLNFRYVDEHWLFHLTKLCKVRHTIRAKESASMRDQWLEYGDDWFVKRLFDDLRQDSNHFLAKEFEPDVEVVEWDTGPDGYFFDLDQNTFETWIQQGVAEKGEALWRTI